MIELKNRFIQNVDLNGDTSLTHLLDRHDTADDGNVKTKIIKHSLFYGQNIISRSRKKMCWIEYFKFKYLKHFFYNLINLY